MKNKFKPFASLFLVITIFTQMIIVRAENNVVNQPSINIEENSGNNVENNVLNNDETTNINNDLENEEELNELEVNEDINTTNTQINENDVNQEVQAGTIYEFNSSSTQEKSNNIYEKEELNYRVEILNNLNNLIPKTDSKYEVALAYPDGSYIYLEDTNDYQEAMNIIENTPATLDDNGSMAVVLDDSGRVVYSDYVMGRVARHSNGVINSSLSVNTDLYSNSDLTGNSIGYVNQGYIDDVPVINYNDKSANIIVTGLNCWINTQSDLLLYPVNQVTNPSYYINKNGVLYHFISYDLTTPGKGYESAIGVAPNFLNEKVKYFSYDGNYFYDGSDITSGLINVICDLKENSNTRAVNSKPYYNYYMYLPFRSKTNHTASEINSYISSNAKSNSKLLNIGQNIIDAENSYGVNAALTLGVAINESGWGTSSIALEKNNIFGLNAIDTNPSLAANEFASISDCINDFTKNWISRGYSDPADWRYFGGSLGNKDFGANVKYASDPFWGEKAAKYAFSLDYYCANYDISKLKDYNSEQLAKFIVKTSVKNSSNTILYPVLAKGSTSCGAKVGNVTIITSGTTNTVNGVLSYPMRPDRETPINNGGSSNKYHGNYVWNSTAYISPDCIEFINIGKNIVPDVDISRKNSWYNLSNGDKYYYGADGKLSKGITKIGNDSYFFDLNTGALKYGWIKYNSTNYYANNEGKLVTGWITDNNIKYYLNSNGTFPTDCQYINNKWYYFKDKGQLYTGWMNRNGKKYYLDSNGIMVIDCYKVDNQWYYFEKSGALITGWMNRNGNKYYLDSNGIMVWGEQKIDNKIYYFNTSGYMVTGIIDINNKKYYHDSNGARVIGPDNYKINTQWYYLNKDGSIKTGWMNRDNKVYYLNSNGIMVSGSYLIDNRWYYFESSGVLKTGWMISNNKKYYLDSNGIMVSGAYLINNQWYYFDNSGAMMTGWMIKGDKKYYLDSNGIMVSGKYKIDGVIYTFNAAGELVS